VVVGLTGAGSVADGSLRAGHEAFNEFAPQ
jgi:hypothetical protein